jgi:hypothetical protein
MRQALFHNLFEYGPTANFLPKMKGKHGKKSTQIHDSRFTLHVNVSLLFKITAMKKLSVLTLVIFGISLFAAAQSSVTSVSYNKVNQPALMLELPYDEDVSEGFILDNLKRTGYDVETKGKLFWKQNKLNGFYTFKEVRLEGAEQPVDLYFKVERKGRKGKDESIIYLLVGKGENNFISSGTDEKTYTAAKNFLNGFVDKSAVYKLDLDIKAQEDAIKDAEKKFEKLQDNEKDLVKKIEQLEKDLKKNKEDQENQQKSIEDEKKKLLELKSKKNA